MKSFLLVIVGGVIGAVASFVLTSATLTGMGAGVGIVTGLQAGACLTVEAAKERGFITGVEVDELLRATVGQMVSAGASDSDATLSGGYEACAKIVADLKKAAQKN